MLLSNNTLYSCGKFIECYSGTMTVFAAEVMIGECPEVFVSIYPNGKFVIKVENAKKTLELIDWYENCPEPDPEMTYE